MRIEGLENANRLLQAAAEIAGGSALMPLMRDEIDDMTLAVMEEARLAAPVREGVLRDSGTSYTRIEGQEIKAGVEFGGLASAYAFPQHYRQDYHHPKGGQAHYLYSSDSPWEKTREAKLNALDAAAGKHVEKFLSAAAGGGG